MDPGGNVRSRRGNAGRTFFRTLLAGPAGWTASGVCLLMTMVGRNVLGHREDGEVIVEAERVVVGPCRYRRAPVVLSLCSREQREGRPGAHQAREARSNESFRKRRAIGRTVETGRASCFRLGLILARP